MDPRTLDDLVRFAADHHPGFANVPSAYLYTMFGTYADSLAIQRGANGRVAGFAIWQDWAPYNLVNVLAIASVTGSLLALKRQIKAAAPGKTIVYYDETLKKLKILCRQLQQPSAPSAQPSAASPAPPSAPPAP